MDISFVNSVFSVNEETNRIDQIKFGLSLPRTEFFGLGLLSSVFFYPLLDEEHDDFTNHIVASRSNSFIGLLFPSPSTIRLGRGAHAGRHPPRQPLFYLVAPSSGR